MLSERYATVWLLATALLGSVANCEDITLKCDEFDRVEAPANMYCTVSGFIVSHSQNVKIPYSSRAHSIKFMKFYDSRLLYVPYKLFDVFPNLKTLDMARTEILDVARHTFSAAYNLTSLVLKQNNITQISTSVFTGAFLLKQLDLGHNKISELNELAFRGLTFLNHIVLSFNELSALSKELFVDNIYLETIVLDNNRLDYIEPEVFSGLLSVSEVYLSNNRLYRFHPDTFATCYQLQTLTLAGNRLQEFALTNKRISDSLNLGENNLTSLLINGTRRVQADHNRIARVEIINKAHMDILQLDHNNISDLRNITDVSTLTFLDVSHNPLPTLNVTTFDQLRRLNTLNLQATGIRQLTFGMFSKLNNLQTLDLSYNNLTELNLDIFVPYLAELKEFLVDANNLTEIQGKRSFYLAFPNLNKLGISRNQFNCSYLHTLLIPPQLSAKVMLHIEPDDSSAETSHIRDVSCVSDVRDTLQNAKVELHHLEQLQGILTQSLETMRTHEKRLGLYLLLMQIALLTLVCLIVGLVVVRLWRRRNERRHFARRGDSIVFQSVGNVNSTIDH